jgi:hypothetical protein
MTVVLGVSATRVSGAIASSGAEVVSGLWQAKKAIPRIRPVTIEVTDLRMMVSPSPFQRVPKPVFRPAQAT